MTVDHYGSRVAALTLKNTIPRIIAKCQTTIEGSLEVKLPTVWTYEETEVGRVREEKRREDNFSKLRCGKSTQLCGAKHISKSKCVKHLSFRALFGVEMSKKCAPSWREAHFEVKMYEIDVEKVHDVVMRSTFRSQQC